MSRYLVDRIENARNIEVMTETEVTAARGDGRLEAVDLRRRGEGGAQRVDTSTMFVMIGADPCTEMVEGMLGVDPRVTSCGKTAACHQGPCRWPLAERDPQPLETVRPGVFAAGDVRAGSTKRVAGAVGDGALAVRFAHEALALA